MPVRCVGILFGPEPSLFAMSSTDKKSRSTEIKSTIQREIETGELRPGEALDERMLAERFGVSRTPVREALQQLVVQNLVRIVPRVGVYVSRLSITQLRESLELLGELEAIAAKLAARRMDEDQRKRVRSAQEQCVQAHVEDDAKLFAKANNDFHEVVYEGSHNEYLIHQIQAIRRLMQRYRPRIFETASRRQRILDDHQLLLDAILRGDEASAHDAMLNHAPVGTTGFSEFLSTLPPSFLEGDASDGNTASMNAPARRGTRRSTKSSAAG